MSLSNKWTRAQLRAAVRRELMDPNARWWTNAELDDYLTAWQDDLQGRFEFIWGSATTAVGSATATLTLAAVATDILRPDAVYWNSRRLATRSKQELDVLDRDWRLSNATTPKTTYQDDIPTISFWPPPGTAGTAVFEYPRRLYFLNDDSPMVLPAWTRYSAVNYCAWRAYLRAGPNHDLQRAMRRKTRYLRQVAWYSTMRSAFLPDRYQKLHPGPTEYEADILDPSRYNYVD